MAVSLPAVTTEKGIMSRMLIAESINPGYSNYDAAKVKAGLYAMKAVVENRLANNPAQFNAPGATTWRQIICTTAPLQWAGFTVDAHGNPSIDKPVTDRIQTVLDKANTGPPGKYHEYVTNVLAVCDDAKKDPFEAITDIGGVKVIGGGFGWRTANSGSPGPRFVAIPAAQGGIIYNNQFFALKK